MQMSLKHLLLQFIQEENSFFLTEHSKLENEQKRTFLGPHLNLNFHVFKKGKKFLLLSRPLLYVLNMMMSKRIA